MMAASLPTLATVPNAQVVYTGSAGWKRSTQLAQVRQRGYARNDPSLMFAEWAAEKPVFDALGELVAGDDPAAESTWRKTNPGTGIRITAGYIRKEMAALGGPRSPEFWRERLGIGDWPLEDETWEVIDKPSWQARADPASQIVDGGAIALAIDADPDRAMGTVGVCGLRADGRRHLEVIERHRGTGWIENAVMAPPAMRREGQRSEDLKDWEQAVVDRMADLKARYRVCAVAVLKTAAAASLITALVRAGLPVQTPSETQYAQACGSLFEAVVDKDTVTHLDQPSVNAAVGGGRKRTTVEGGWRWSRSSPVDAAPIVVETLALWAFEEFGSRVPRSKVW
jgi:hypothetical protein